jgi:hypothetical protein
MAALFNSQWRQIGGANAPVLRLLGFIKKAPCFYTTPNISDIRILGAHPSGGRLLTGNVPVWLHTANALRGFEGILSPLAKTAVDAVLLINPELDTRGSFDSRGFS